MVVDCLIHKTKISWAKVFEHSIWTQGDNLASMSVSYLAAYAVNLYVKDDHLTKVEQKEEIGLSRVSMRDTNGRC
jgi:hypothetical protein